MQSDYKYLLQNMGVMEEIPSIQYLRDLQTAWTFYQPFHNIDLLADFLQKKPPLDREQSWERCLKGLGGPCHVQSSSFLFLLEQLGFDAHFCSGHINHEGDHLLVCVQVEGKSFICDVGNGHPYLYPFPILGEHHQVHLGWEIRSKGDGTTLSLEQKTPFRKTWKKVFTATTKKCAWNDFSEGIHRHHTEIGFGPFLTGLRAIRLGQNSAIILRDDSFMICEDSIWKTTTIINSHSHILSEIFRLKELHINDALKSWFINTDRLSSANNIQLLPENN